MTETEMLNAFDALIETAQRWVIEHSEPEFELSSDRAGERAGDLAIGLAFTKFLG